MRERERQTDRQTDTDRQTESDRQPETERQTETERQREKDRDRETVQYKSCQFLSQTCPAAEFELQWPPAYSSQGSHSLGHSSNSATGTPVTFH